MKKIITVLAFLTIALVMISPIKTKAEPPPDMPCVCCPPFKMLGTDCALPPSDVLLIEDLLSALSEITTTQKELSKASQYARATSIRINYLVKKIKMAINLPAALCKKSINANLARLDIAIKNQESRGCSSTNTSRCIPADTVSQFLPRCHESFQEIQSIFEVDDDGSGLPDVCRG